MHALPRRAYAHFTPVTGPRSARFAHFSRIRLADGTGGEGTGGAPGGQSGTGDPAGQSDPAGTGQEQPQAAATGDDNPWDDPAKAKAEIERLRRENGAARTNAKQQAADEARDAVVQEIGKALGLIKEGTETPDAAALAKAAQEAAVEARTAKVELAVHQRAASHKADPGALLDSRAFLTKVADLDPTAADFTSKVDDAIKAAVQANPKLAATQVVGASSVDHAGGSGEGNHRPTTLNAAVSAAYQRQ